MRTPSSGWIRYLQLVTGSVVVIGLVLVLAPGLTEASFALLVFGSTRFPNAFSASATSYARLTHAIIGAVMVGWFLLVTWVVRSPLRAGQPGAWGATALSLATWFVLDSTFSLVTGYWQNAALNVVFLGAYLPGLLATCPRRTTHRLHP